MITLADNAAASGTSETAIPVEGFPLSLDGLLSIEVLLLSSLEEPQSLEFVSLVSVEVPFPLDVTSELSLPLGVEIEGTELLPEFPSLGSL